MFSNETNRIIDLMADKAIRRIQRDGLKSHSEALASAKSGLESFRINSAVAAQEVHNRINDRLVALGLLRREANWLVAA